MDDQRSSKHVPEPAAESGREPARARSTPRCQRLECEGFVLEHNLPDQFPILPTEIELLRLYFGDLIDQALKAPK
jgi:hypothetical protein